ncbi:hypothetical protein pb186bvf_018954 [Paramecium bursaria]
MFLYSFEMIQNNRMKFLSYNQKTSVYVQVCQLLFKVQRSALILLADLYKLEKQLFRKNIYQKLNNQGGEKVGLKPMQLLSLNKLNGQIQILENLIEEWEL